MLDYKESTEYLYNCLPMFSTSGAGAYKPGLATSLKLSEAFGNPHKNLRTVHIAGTNGKGSTSNAIASALAEAGYRTGLYTSPHIHDFRERIRINGEMISPDAVADFTNRYLAMEIPCEPSFFELTTIMAFEYFARMNTDIAVIETGLGGRLDTTNIITPEICVITNVSLDHTAQLGNTIESIAREKAGIIKPGVPVVIGRAEGAVRKVFEEKAAEAGAPIYFAFEETKKQPYESDLEGEFQEENLRTALTALRIMGIDEDAIRRGFSKVCANTGFKGRWTTYRAADPKIIYDTGHNIGAWEYLAPRLERIASENKLRVVLGFVSDKDIEPIFKLLPSNAEYYFVTLAVKRGRDSAQLLALAHERGLNARAFPSVQAGYESALAASGKGDTVFVGGSNYLVAEIEDFNR